MPTSHPYQINEIIQIAELVKPKKILDIGIGNGKYGFLLREYLGSSRGLCKEDIIIDGIEGYQDYISECHKETYNEIHIMDLCDIGSLTKKEYDLCLLIDIIEHFDRDKGMEIIHHFHSTSDLLLIATPWDIGAPEIRHDNPLEDHKYQWLKKDFQHFQYHSFVFNINSLMVLLGKDQGQVNFISRKMRSRSYKNFYDLIRRSIGLKKEKVG